MGFRQFLLRGKKLFSLTFSFYWDSFPRKQFSLVSPGVAKSMHSEYFRPEMTVKSFNWTDRFGRADLQIQICPFLTGNQSSLQGRVFESFYKCLEENLKSVD